MIRTIRLRERVKHNTRDNIATAQAIGSQIFVRPMVAIRQKRADVDMGEQLSDLDSERDYMALMCVGVHRPTGESLAEWEAVLTDVAWPECNFGSRLVQSSRSPGYEVAFDGYFVERSMCAIRVEPVIEDAPMVVTQSDYARKRARKHQANLEARKRTLTPEQRKEILRRESVGMRGFSRV